MKAISIANIEDRRYSYIPFSEDFYQAFGNREKTGNWIVYGKAGQGKTRFVLQLAKEFDRIGYKVLLASLEMGFCADFQKDLHDSGIRSKVQKIVFTDAMTLPDLEDMLGKQRSPDVIIIDSLQYFVNQYDATAEGIIALRKKFRSKIFVYVSHVDGKEVEGKAAYSVKRDSFVRIQVEGFRAKYIGRGKGGPVGHYTVWDEGEEKYWLQHNNSEDGETSD
nr:MAG TPA: FeS assembly-ype transport system, ATPase component [Caudoviricetes sp.]